MPTDVPVASDLIDAAALHLETQVVPHLSGLGSVGTKAALRALQATPNQQVLQVVALYLVKRVRPAMRGWDAFQVLIAAHLLMIAKREMQLGTKMQASDRAALRKLLGRTGTHEELESKLVDRLRDDAGPMDRDEWTGILDYLRFSAVQRQTIANPNYLIEGA